MRRPPCVQYKYCTCTCAVLEAVGWNLYSTVNRLYLYGGEKAKRRVSHIDCAVTNNALLWRRDPLASPIEVATSQGHAQTRSLTLPPVWATETNVESELEENVKVQSRQHAQKKGGR